MFGLNSEDIGALFNEGEELLDKHSYGRIIRDFKRSFDSMGKYSLADFSSIEFPSIFPSIFCFGKLFPKVDNSEVCVKQKLIPCTFSQIGVKSRFGDNRVYKTSSLVSVYSSCCALLYYYDEYGALDISPYLAYMLDLGYEDMYISISPNGRLAQSFYFSISDFVVNSVSPVVCDIVDPVFEEVIVQKEPDFFRFLTDPAGLDCSDKVVLDISGDISSLKILPATSLFIPNTMNYDEGMFGGVVGYWINISVDYSGYRIFISSDQLSFFPWTFWGLYSLFTLFKGKFIITPLIDSFVVPDYIKLRNPDVSSLEICHHATSWVCDVSTMFRKFEYRTCGLFDIDHAKGFDSYQGAYTQVPRISAKLRSSCRSHLFLPCGICPIGGNGKSKDCILDRSRKIKAFNFGVVGICPSMEQIIGDVAYITQSAYGIKFLKYQTPYMMPHILNAYRRNPKLCSCSFGEPCELCEDISFSSDACVSMLKGKCLADWSDRFRVYYVAGKHYVYGDDPNYSGFYDNMSARCDPTKKVTLMEVAAKFLADLYCDHSNSNPFKFLSGASDFMFTFDSFDKRFFGIVTMLRKSGNKPQSHNIWIVVSHFFGKLLDVINVDYRKASSEFSDLYRAVLAYDRDGFISDSDALVLKGRLKFGDS